MGCVSLHIPFLSFQMATTYAEKLKDPRWQKKRLEVLQRDNFCCQSCSDNENMLIVHHLKYESRNPWETDSKYLITLCQRCHEFEHEHRKVHEDNLLDALKEFRFLCADVHKIKEGFHFMKSNIHPEILSTILYWALSSGELKNIEDRYFDYISKINEKNATKRAKRKL